MHRQVELIEKAWNLSRVSKIFNPHLTFLEPVLGTGSCLGLVCLCHCCHHLLIVSELFYLWKLSASTLTVNNLKVNLFL